MRYGSVCSGIEAASVAWHPLGWQPSFFSEIESFPRAVLAHRWPKVKCHGDFTTIKAGEYAPIDLLVGGTPCQSFSVAGLRGGLADERGNLALEYLRLAQRLRPRWLVWENVPGVLSSAGGRDFGAILGGLVELGYGFAYRVLDAQYIRVDGFGRAVPQRRRRVFVVGCAGDWRRAAAVLFERESLRGNPPPRREPGQGAAPTISARPTGGGGLGTDFDLDGGLIANSLTASRSSTQCPNEDTTLIASTGDVSLCLNAGGMGRTDYETETMVAVAHALRGEGFDASEDGTGRGTPIVPVAYDDPRRFNNIHGGSGSHDVMPTLESTNPKQILATAVAFAHQAGGPVGGNQGGDFVSQPIAIQERAICENPNAGPDGAGIRTDGAAYTLEARTVPQAVAFVHQAGGIQTTLGYDLEAGTAPTLAKCQTPAVQFGWRVRRLTPTECEALQGFPRNYTNIPYRGKPDAPDGPRYKALGNSMAVNAMRWIGRRIEMVEASNG